MHNPPRILVADDNQDNRDILAAQLASEKYELLQAADGEAALVAARNHHPDLILLDIVMPKLDGLEVCRRLKRDFQLAIYAHHFSYSEVGNTGCDSRTRSRSR